MRCSHPSWPVLNPLYQISYCVRGLDQGHYISIVKCGTDWVSFDDDRVEIVTSNPTALQSIYGAATKYAVSSRCAYILFYTQSTEGSSLCKTYIT